MTDEATNAILAAQKLTGKERETEFLRINALLSAERGYDTFEEAIELIPQLRERIAELEAENRVLRRALENEGRPWGPQYYRHPHVEGPE